MLAALALTASFAADPTSEPRGNILILIADDLGTDVLATYGAPDAAPTPNLDQLAREGVLYLDAWAQPTCSPARATIQTGRYGFRTGIGEVINAAADGPALPLAEVTLPEMLDLGTGGAYAHAAIGKWHLGSSQVGGDLAPNLAAYSYFAGSLEGQLPHYDNWRRVVNGVAGAMFRYATSACVDDALSWIQAQSRPWLCVVSFQAPHAPFHRPPQSLHTQVLPDVDPRNDCSQPGTDPWPFYKATVQALDTEIGRLLRSLSAGERARTTVFFLGDNGSDGCIARPPAENRAKGTLYESGVRVPFLASGYRVERARTSRELVSTTDLFATVAELAGVDLAATLGGLTLDSRSLVPSLRGLQHKSPGGRTWLYAESFAPNGTAPVPLPPCPPPDDCQPSLGFDGPGAATLAACGPPLYDVYGEHTVAWQVAGAPPSANAWLVIGPYEPAYEPSVGATLVSPSPDHMDLFVTEADGTFEGTTWTGNTSGELHYQVVVQDPTQPGGFGVTNALRMEFLPAHQRAVRGLRYKLIRIDPCHEELYDLRLDPHEQSNLLARPLSASELAAYQRLAAVLDSLG